MEAYEEAYEWTHGIVERILKGLEILLEAAESPHEREKWLSTLEVTRKVDARIEKANKDLRRDKIVTRIWLAEIQDLWERKGLDAEEKVLGMIKSYEDVLPDWSKWVDKETKRLKKLEPSVRKYVDYVEAMVKLAKPMPEIMTVSVPDDEDDQE